MSGGGGNGFLHRLVSRAGAADDATTARVRPRLAARFELVGPEESGGSLNETEAEGAVTSGRAFTPQTTAAATDVDRVHRGLLVEPAPAVAAPRTEPTAPVEAPWRPVVAPAEPDTSSRHQLSPVAPPAPEPVASSRAAEPRPAVVDDRVVAPRTAPAPATARPVAPSAAPAVPPGPHRQSRAAASRDAEADRELPVVHVTIGRVEIRTAPARRGGGPSGATGTGRRPATVRAPLDDYLDERSGSASR